MEKKFKIENNILKGKEVPFEINYPSLGQFVLDTLEHSADFVGQIDAITGEEYTFGKMRERSVRCALWMKSQGVLAGDIVTMCSHNHLDFAIACFAASYLGAVFSPWDAELNRTDFRHLFNLINPKIAFVSETSVAAFAEAARDASPDVRIIVFGRVPGFLEFESVIAEPGAEEVKNFSCAKIESVQDIAAILCSSGTTGMPKGVALSHRCWLMEIHRSTKRRRGRGSSVVFSSPSWISWTMTLFMNLALNITNIVSPPFDEHSACALIEKYKPGLVLFASSMVNRLLKFDALKQYDISGPKFIGYVGAPLAVSSREAFSKLVPKANIWTGYGLTEVCCGVSTPIPNGKPGSCGQIGENVQLKVIDPNTGKTLGPNQTGQLLVKTATMMNSYYNNPKATAEALDEEGWFHSGDLGYYDEDGEIFIVDRMKELIKYRGYQVSPVEIENVLFSHPGVKEAAVVGVPHPVDDEHPVAFVVKAEDFSGTGKEVTEAELMDLVAAELSDTKRLRGGIRFLDRLPKTPSHKIQRRQLRDLAAKSMVDGLTPNKEDKTCIRQ